MLTEEDEKIILKNTLHEMLNTVKVCGSISAGIIAYLGIVIGVAKVFGGDFQDALMIGFVTLLGLFCVLAWFVYEYGAAEEKYKRGKTLRG